MRFLAGFFFTNSSIMVVVVGWWSPVYIIYITVHIFLHVCRIRRWDVGGSGKWAARYFSFFFDLFFWNLEGKEEELVWCAFLGRVEQLRCAFLAWNKPFGRCTLENYILETKKCRYGRWLSSSIGSFRFYIKFPRVYVSKALKPPATTRSPRSC